MSEFATGYQALGSAYDEEQEEQPPNENIIHVVPDPSKVRWNHIEDLDEFFTRVYQYHQRSGFLCMVVQDFLQIIQFIFVVLFSMFLWKCVDYEILFNEKPLNGTHKVTLDETIYPLDQCADRFDGFMILCLTLAALFFVFRIIKLIYNIFAYVEIRAFYMYALKIPANELPNMTWHEVQHRLLEVQKEQQMCIHKRELTELDIYHRILRFKNYMVSMINKSLMPFKFRLPIFGDYIFLSTGLKYNIEMLLFWGPWSPFENNWHLNADYKNYHRRKELSDKLSKHILWVGIANLLLCPIIFLWQILYSFFRYAETIKREPGFLGSRRWSLFARLYLRHFNELDHEFDARLNRGYKGAERYMNIFTSPLLVIIAKHFTFFSASILSVLIILTLIDEDFLAVSHVIVTMTVLGVFVTISRSCIPDEHLVFCPELLMRNVLGHIHYIPDHWKGNAHTYRVRDEFAQVFQYKAVYVIEELLSPIVTPLILIFRFRHKSLEIVDFYRNFTVDVTGVGDVCSFAQMDVRKHGHPQWNIEGKSEANQYQQAEDGKTELSLVHFTLTNPEWKPPQTGSIFLKNLKDMAQKDAHSLSLMPLDNPLVNSLHSLTSMGYQGYGYNSLYSSIAQQSAMSPAGTPGGTTSYAGAAMPLHSPPSVTSPTGFAVRGGIKNAEGPIGGSRQGLLSNIDQNSMVTSVPPLGRTLDIHSYSATGGLPSCPRVDEETLELLSQEMTFSALYMHELHRHKINNPYHENLDDVRARNLWQSTESPQESGPPLVPSGVTVQQHAGDRLPTQQEEDEDEEEEVDNSILPLLPQNKGSIR